MDLYQMKGDRFAQDELLNEISASEVKGIGADLYLGNWDPERGTWDDIRVIPNDGTESIPLEAYDYNDSPPWEILQRP
jgi:hypothetical protein